MLGITMMIEAKEIIDAPEEFKHFCDNPNCPNHKLELNDERHYHDCESSAITVGSICGILQTHAYSVDIKTNYRLTGFFRKKVIYDVEKKIYYFCDICNFMTTFLKHTECS